MRKSVRFNKMGFTLVELMIVVAIIGILAALAIVGVSKYVRSAKTTEARNALGKMGKAAQTAFAREKPMPAGSVAIGGPPIMFRGECPSASASVPATMASVTGTKYQSSDAEWKVDEATNSGFWCLRVFIQEPQYYEYSYISDATPATQGLTCTAMANGDLNGDGVYSTLMLFGNVTQNMLSISPNLGEVLAEE
jgi:type IV pilus assembly protein PilA